MEIRKWAEKDGFIASHLVGHIHATREEIEKAFGKAHDTDIDGKVQYEWVFYVDGHIVTLYDWKECYFGYNDRICWHIGSDCDAYGFVERVKEEITKRIKA